MLFLGKKVSENAIIVAFLKQFVCSLGKDFKLFILISTNELEMFLEEFET